MLPLMMSITKQGQLSSTGQQKEHLPESDRTPIWDVALVLIWFEFLKLSFSLHIFKI